MMSLLPQRWVPPAALRWVSWILEGLGVTLPCASVKSSRLLPEVLDDCLPANRKLCPRERAIMRDLRETVLARQILETGGIGCSESCEKVGYSILST